MSHPKYPPYMKALAAARRQGMVPWTRGGWFHVCLGWATARLIRDKSSYPMVVIPLDAETPMASYDLRPLSGLDLKLVYSPGDDHYMEEAAGLILAVRPRTLYAHTLPYVAGSWRSWQGRGETLLPGVRESCA